MGLPLFQIENSEEDNAPKKGDKKARHVFDQDRVIGVVVPGRGLFIPQSNERKNYYVKDDGLHIPLEQ